MLDYSVVSSIIAAMTTTYQGSPLSELEAPAEQFAPDIEAEYRRLQAQIKVADNLQQSTPEYLLLLSHATNRFTEYFIGGMAMVRLFEDYGVLESYYEKPPIIVDSEDEQGWKMALPIPSTPSRFIIKSYDQMSVLHPIPYQLVYYQARRGA